VEIKKYHLISVINYTMMALITASAMPLALLIVRKLLINDIGWAGAGYWQAVWKISEVYLGIITIALTTYLLPQLSVIKESVLIKKEINLLSPYIISVAVFLAVSIYILRDVCLSVLFTQDFYSARDLFLYQLVGDVFKVAGFLYAYPMIVQARTKIYISLEIFISSI
ncbi:TPA: O-antigen flippase, partial [Escherichia coli]